MAWRLRLVLLGASATIALGCGSGGGKSTPGGGDTAAAPDTGSADGTGTPDEGPCVPKCDGKDCGDDGCGGTCGDCTAPATCSAEGKCVTCEPLCAGRDCGDDGCGGSCGECTAPEVCSAEGKCVGCEPDCTGKECGDDGCGGSCGECTAPKTCNDEGECVACDPECTGKDCGDDGCGGSCGDCTAPEVCSEEGKCVGCEPECTGKDCGDDGCEGSCGECTAPTTCNDEGKCVACDKDCDGKMCGDDGCGGTCGECVDGTSCTETFKCKVTEGESCEGKCGVEYDGDAECQCDTGCFYFGDCCLDLCSFCGDLPDYAGDCEPCIPACDGKECGADGCDGTCGECAGDDVCTSGGTCCSPSCDGKVCGMDGCGGSCGACEEGKACSAAGACVDATEAEGNTCANPFMVGELPFEATGDSSDASDVYSYGNDECPFEKWGNGGASPDEVWAYTPAAGGFVTIEVGGKADTTVFVLTDCSAPVADNCLGASEHYGDEELSLPVAKGTTYFIVVDGYGNTSDNSGPYTISVKACEPACAGDQECGDNACGGTCGECADGSTCGPENKCIALSCKGSCGGQSAAGCWCDAKCFELGNCCKDACTECYDDLKTQCDCVPACDGKACGSDGCFGTCGKCAAGLTCTEGGQCVDPATLVGNTCSTPFTIDAVPFVGTGDTSKGSNDYEYGDDVCEGEPWGEGDKAKDQVFAFTPAVTGIYTIEVKGFDAALYVVSDCSSIDATTCLGASETSGSGESLELTLKSGTIYYIIVDGYGTYDGAYTLTIGDPCVPSCGGKVCGTDGCGGGCGVCPAGKVCDLGGQCADAASMGDTCDTAVAIPALPFVYAGDTTELSSDYNAPDTCEGGGADEGWESSDQLFLLTVTKASSCTAKLADLDGDPDAMDSILYVTGACPDAVDPMCYGSDDVYFHNGQEEVSFELDAVASVFIVVDGWSSVDNEAGKFELTVDCKGACAPACGDKKCGPDGCGGTCGGCAAGETCDEDGKCVGPAPSCQGKCGAAYDSKAPCQCNALCKQFGNCCDDFCDLCGVDFPVQCGLLAEGDSCLLPYAVGALPYTVTKSTAGAKDDYSYAKAACPGMPDKGWGLTAPDHVYGFVPGWAGQYRMSVSGASWGATVYVVKDCTDVNGTCLGADEKFGDATEQVTVNLDAGVQVFVIVDGYGDSKSGEYTLKVEALTEAPKGGLVLNEVDYDQTGTDSAEFVELFNASGASIALAGLTLELMNGTGNVSYKSFPLADAGAELGPGQFLVVGVAAVTGALPVGVLKINATPATNLIQNGDPDAVQIRNAAGEPIDGMSYGGVMEGVTEGTASAPKDTATGSLSRCPDGLDTGNNATDFKVAATPTPGMPNHCVTK